VVGVGDELCGQRAEGDGTEGCSEPSPKRVFSIVQFTVPGVVTVEVTAIVPYVPLSAEQPAGLDTGTDVMVCETVNRSSQRNAEPGAVVLNSPTSDAPVTPDRPLNANTGPLAKVLPPVT
jgi:hypothetical protein